MMQMQEVSSVKQDLNCVKQEVGTLKSMVLQIGMQSARDSQTPSVVVNTQNNISTEQVILPLLSEEMGKLLSFRQKDVIIVSVLTRKIVKIASIKSFLSSLRYEDTSG